MRQNSSEKLSIELSKLLQRIYEYCAKHVNQPFGVCLVTPKHASVPLPTKEIQLELEKRATAYFEKTKASGYYFRYSTPPILPILKENEVNQISKLITADDYLMTMEFPQFDEKWQQIIIARSLIYCPLDEEQHGWSDWFELQHEAIRFTPILHQTLEELKVKFQIKVTLTLPAKPIFQSFIYEYALNDKNFPEMTLQERKLWESRKIDWKIRYKLVVDVIKSAKTLSDLYILARKKFTSTRNPMLKLLFGKLVSEIENNLILNKELPEQEKKLLIFQLRQGQNKKSKKKYTPSRPTFCISDLECGQMLYLLIQDFLASKEKIKSVAETILFILIAQHAAFSDLKIKEKDVLGIRIKDINHLDLTIQIQGKEINITGGLSQILIAWTDNKQRINNRLLFQNLTYDILENIITKCSSKYYGSSDKLLPKDFLEKVHVIAGLRISIEIRRQITEQEKLVKTSPYRINEREIKKHIKAAIQEKRL